MKFKKMKEGRFHNFLNLLPRLQSLGQCPQVTRSNLDGVVRTRGLIVDALLLDIGLVGAASVPHGMTAGVPEGGVLAGFDAFPCHCRQRVREEPRGIKWFWRVFKLR